VVDLLLPVVTEAKSPPTLRHVIPGYERDEGAAIRGLAVVNNQLFVLRYPTFNEIQVYETESFALQRTVGVPIFCGDRQYMGLASSDASNCLYLCAGDVVYKVDLSTDSVTEWQVSGCNTVSVNAATGHVVVTCWTAVHEYTASGELVRTVALDESRVNFASHAVQLVDNHFIVCHDEGVSLIDELGRVTTTYGNGRPVQRLVCTNLSAITSNGTVLAVDDSNGRLVALNCALSGAREMSLPIDSGMVKMQGPFWIYFDEPCRRLYVGEGEDAGWGRVFVFDNVNI